MQFLGIRVLLKRIKAIRFMMADKNGSETKESADRFRYHLPVFTYRSYTADLVSDRLDR